MTPQYNTAEGGSNGVTPTTSDAGSGDSLGLVTPGAVSTIQYSSAHPAHGSLGYKLANNTATAEIATIGQLEAGGGAASVFGGFYYLCDVTPSATLRVARLRKNAAGIVGSIYHSTGNALQIRNGSDVLVYTFSNLMTPGTLYRVEWNVIVNGTTAATLQAKMFAGDSASPIEDSTAQAVTANAATSAVDLITYGGGSTSASAWPNNSAGGQYLDDLKAFFAAFPGPVASLAVPTRTLLGVGI